MKNVLKMLAPWLSVGLFWCVFKNGWLAILGYHLQAVLWERPKLASFKTPNKTRTALFVLPAILGGPMIYFILPYIADKDMSIWLTEYKVTGLWLMLMIPYFGVLHPFIEQHHWSKLREATPWSHIMFAGYHVLVLYSLLSITGTVFCFIALAVVSYIWMLMGRRSGSLVAPVMSHILADFGIVLAAWYMLTR